MPDSNGARSGKDAIPPEMATQFLLALRMEEFATPQSMIVEHPTLARFSVHTAAASGDADCVAQLLAEDPALATLAAPDDGPEPLIFAAHCGLQSLLHVSEAERVRTVTLLLDAGASPNAFVQLREDPRSRIPALYFACVSGNTPVCRVLLERGATPNDGESVYHAAERDHRDCLELLVSHGADISRAHSHWGNTPLYFVCGHHESSALRASAERGVAWLLEHGADPDVLSYPRPDGGGPPGVGEAPLHRVAASDRSTTMASMLLTHGATVDLPRSDGKTAYVLAYRAANIAMAMLLAQHGARTDALGPTDRFLAACLTADDAEAGALLAARPDLMQSLSDDERHVLTQAVMRDHPDALSLMISLGWSLTDEGEWGGTPLHWAAWFGRPKAVRTLLDFGAPVNVRDRTYGSSPIAWAAHGSTNARRGTGADYVSIVQQLLDAGATREASFNAWEEPPERMASPAVAALLHDSGFTAR